MRAPQFIRKPADGEVEPQSTTVWSFQNRGSWATHRGDYRGNWSPHIPRNLLARFSKPGDLVLDQMVGSGTTLVEAKLMGRRGIGVDVNEGALKITAARLEFECEGEAGQHLFLGDARNLTLIPDGHIDLALTHPPYWSIIRYSDSSQHDLSQLDSVLEFFEALGKIASEAYRVLKPGGHCAILMGDTRRNGHYVPLCVETLQRFLRAGFLLRENIIKLQWNVSSEREKWTACSYSFYKIQHEQLFVFRKPLNEADRASHGLSADKFGFGNTT